MKQIALITGASSGLGREFARFLAQEAVDELWLVARREERLRGLASEVALPCRVFALDLTQESALEELSAALSAEPVTVRWLVNAAGFGRIGMAADIGAATTGRETGNRFPCDRYFAFEVDGQCMDETPRNVGSQRKSHVNL